MLDQKYQERYEKFAQQARLLEAQYTRFSFVRLAYFAAGIALLIYCSTLIHWYTIGLAGLFLWSFARLVRWHLNLQAQKNHNKALATINQNERAFLNHDYSMFYPGKEFIDPAHPYSVDLDLFGEHSFFQYTNRCSTTIGHHRLADYLKTLSTATDIQDRQAAIQELAPLLDWRQHFQAHGMHTQDSMEHLKNLNIWLSDPPFMLSNRVLKACLYIFPFIVALGIYLWIFYLPWPAAILFFLPSLYVLRQTLDKVNKAHVQTTYAEKILSNYARLMSHIESNRFQSPQLQQLHQTFIDDQGHASLRLKRLSYLIAQLNLRYNAFAFLLNVFALWDLHWIWRLEQWKAEQKDNLPKWFNALAEMEALVSLATLYYNAPDWTFPQITDSQSPFNAQALGHPLIPVTQRVCNDIQIPTGGHIKLVTGSNMAGKSTFLRTVGLNIVLAMAGAPVCAQRCALPLLQVYTSMRTQDALHESTSSFYAELKRLKTIIEAVEQQSNAFFLLDEILKGTNSNDRHTGSKALIHQLIKSQGSGIIATHDLELGALEASSNGSVENLCMEVAVENNELIFDYTIKKGVSKSFNATHLMRNMGINI
ncbi:MAG: hypothetical protein AAGD05_06770 [Bacteroidota bacterium]